MMKKAWLGATVAGVLACGALSPTETKASTLLGTFQGNDCAGLFGTPPNCVASFTDPAGNQVLAPTPLNIKFDFVFQEIVITPGVFQRSTAVNSHSRLIPMVRASAAGPTPPARATR